MPRIPGLGTSRLTPAELKRRAAKVRLLVLDVDGVLTDGGMYYGPDGEVMKKFDTRDGQGIVLAMRSGIEVAFLTLEATSFSRARAKKLGVRHCIIGSKSKTDDLKALQDLLNVSKDQTAYVGDDLGDVPCISKVGIFFTPADGWIAHHGVTVVLERKGGAGAVRQAIQWILDQRGVNMPRRAFITGITGQDGSYLAEFLLDKGYEVHGMVRRVSSFARERIDPRRDRLHLHYGDMTDAASLTDLLRRVEPQEIYNLASQSHVQVSFRNPIYSFEVDGLGALQLFEAARLLRKPPRIFQAGSGELFGRGRKGRLKESDDFRPYSPYGCAKLFAHWQAVNFREGFGLFVANGILFNHESPRRAENFVSRKITRAAARIRLGLQDRLVLGHLDSKRDWGFAGDYVAAMWAMLQRKQADDFVIATGVSRSVRDFCAEAFGAVGLDWRKYVTADPGQRRALDPGELCGDASKARRLLKWKPRTGFRSLVRMMVDEDLRISEREAALAQA